MIVTTPHPIHLPFAPLWAFYSPHDDVTTLAPHERDANMSKLAARLDVGLRSLHRWVVEGIPLYAADEAACALGVNPVAIWPTWDRLPLISERLGVVDMFDPFGLDPEDPEPTPLAALLPEAA